jgi:hypothetical protein
MGSSHAATESATESAAETAADAARSAVMEENTNDLMALFLRWEN